MSNEVIYMDDIEKGKGGRLRLIVRAAKKELGQKTMTPRERKVWQAQLQKDIEQRILESN